MNLAHFHPSLGNLPGSIPQLGTSAAVSGLNRLWLRLTGHAFTGSELTHSAIESVTEVEPASQFLEQGQIAAVTQPGLKKVICVVGSLWLTQDGRGKDVVLESGQEFQCDYHDRNARLLVYALSNARWQLG